MNTNLKLGLLGMVLVLSLYLSPETMLGYYHIPGSSIPYQKSWSLFRSLFPIGEPVAYGVILHR